jgi:hypothetical protein
VDRRDIEEKLREYGLGLVNFVEEAHKWINDMETVAFDFRRDNLAGGMMSLSFAQELLKLNPSQFEYFDIGGWVYVRMRWDRNSITLELMRTAHK